LVQTIKSDLYLTSSVFIEINQQGRANKFNYNHWFSPPSPSNNTANNAPCTIAGVMTDGLYATPRNSSWLSGFDGSAGSATTPMSVARYCLHKLVNNANWVKIAETGILSQLLAGQGYKMKGS
jgi:hypothetical protein